MRDAISEILTNRVFSYTRAHEYTHSRIYIVHVIIYHVSRRIYYNILSSMEITFNRYIHNTYFVRTLYLLLQKMICRRLRNNITFAMHACASIKKRNNINRETTTLNRIIMLVGTRGCVYTISMISPFTLKGLTSNKIFRDLLDFFFSKINIIMTCTATTHYGWTVHDIVLYIAASAFAVWKYYHGERKRAEAIGFFSNFDNSWLQRIAARRTRETCYLCLLFINVMWNVYNRLSPRFRRLKHSRTQTMNAVPSEGAATNALKK